MALLARRSDASNRRRRWLHHEQTNSGFHEVKRGADENPSNAEFLEANADDKKARRFRFQLAPKSNWVLVSLILLNFLMLGLACLAAWSTQSLSLTSNLSSNLTSAGTAGEQLVERANNQLLWIFCQVQMGLCSLLASSIFWYRSSSRKDFMGRYRIWGWTGVFWCLVLISGLSGGVFPWLKELLVAVSLNDWRPDVVAWLFPISVGVIASYRVLRREVRQSRKSLYAWEFTFAFGVMTALLMIGLDSVIPMAYREVVLNACTGTFLCSMVSSLLIHLQYVAHVSRESPPRQLSRSSRVLRWGQKRILVLGEKVLTVKPPHRLERWRRGLNRQQNVGSSRTIPEKTAPLHQASNSKVPDQSQYVDSKTNRKHRIDQVESSVSDQSTGQAVGQSTGRKRAWFSLVRKTEDKDKSKVKNVEPKKRGGISNFLSGNYLKRTSAEKVETRREVNDNSTVGVSVGAKTDRPTSGRWMLKRLLNSFLNGRKTRSETALKTEAQALKGAQKVPETQAQSRSGNDSSKQSVTHFSKKKKRDRVMGKAGLDTGSQRVVDQDDGGPKVDQNPPRKGPGKELNSRVKN